MPTRKVPTGNKTIEKRTLRHEHNKCFDILRGGRVSFSLNSLESGMHLKGDALLVTIFSQEFLLKKKIGWFYDKKKKLDLTDCIFRIAII